MEGTLDEILDNLPEKPPRSCLESFRDFINELRRRKRTYREIAQILEEKCQLRVSKSTVHRFLRSRSRQKRQSRATSSSSANEDNFDQNQPAPNTETHSNDG
jgi:IS30 family transposase